MGIVIENRPKLEEILMEKIPANCTRQLAGY